MARQPRIDLPGVAQHVIQRGNDRQPCFFRDIDRVRYLQDLRELTLAGRCHVHAYVLMTNHVHLLITPGVTGAISKVMQSLGRRYVRYINDAYGRTGTLWEGRYKSHLVADDDHLLRCYRYIELNPVRAGMVAHAADYRWSSYRRNALGQADPLVRPHDCYRRLGITDTERLPAYRDLVQQACEEDAARFSDHLRHQHPMGNDRFRATIEAQLGRKLTPGKGGRPKKRRPET
ncbi:transposase [Stenotrophomonas sp. SY1]|uniref:transposase n=1 Tax=Stenotrophomonas sp. SY1 TaxID=477235 RepID=UPI001E2D9AA1|nr:transposase [Stenotrophomonas sp. SY1]MCD9088270.1 transposase [Stenotrophomonas sp. SY1]